MKIALIHYRLIRKGGLETRLLNYIIGFHKMGHQVTVVVSKSDKNISLPEGVSIVHLSPGLTLKPFRKSVFARKVHLFLSENQFDFSLSLGRTTGQNAVLAPANHLGYLAAIGRKRMRFSDRMEHRLDKNAFVSSECIFAASNMIKKELVKHYLIPESKIDILHPPLNREHFHMGLNKDSHSLKKKWGMNPDMRSFLFVSVSHERKGLPLLLKVFENLRDEAVELFIAGTPGKATALPNVHFLGFRQNLIELYSAADFTIHPAIYEPFGQIISESLACGTPVIVSDKTGAGEILTGNEGIICSGRDPKIWTKIVKEIHPGDFHIQSDFINKSGLNLQQHLEKMLSAWAKFSKKQ